MIELLIEGGLWTVTLNRPEKANSLTGAMLDELLASPNAQEPRVLGRWC